MQQLSVSRLFDGATWFDNVSVVIEHGLIQAITPATGPVQQASLVPGFIDVQVNGGGGVLFNNSPTPQTLATMLQAHSQFGTTAMLPTVITDSVALMQRAADAVAVAIAAKQPGIIGVHLKGRICLCRKKACIRSSIFVSLVTKSWRFMDATIWA